MNDNGNIVKKIGQGLPEYRLGEPGDLAIGTYRDSRYIAARFGHGWEFGALVKALPDFANRDGNILVFPDGATTPDISKTTGLIRFWQTANSSAKSISNFTGAPTTGSVVGVLMFNDTNTTITHTAGKIHCDGGASLGPMSQYDALIFVWMADRWLQIGGSYNS